METKFKRLLKEKGYTVQGLADKAGVSKRSLDGYMTGHKNWANSHLWFALKISEALEINPSELLNESPQADG